MTVRIEPDKKKKFEMLCKDFGMSANTAFTVFVNSVIRNQSIPFAISTKKEEDTVTVRGMRAFEALRKNAKKRASPGTDCCIYGLWTQFCKQERSMACI